MSHFAPPPVAHRQTVHLYLTIREVRQRPDLEKIVPVGEIDLCTAPVLARVLEDADRRQVPNVLVDLSQVDFLALVGVQTLLTATAKAAATNRRMVVVAPTATVQRVLSLSDVTGELEIYTSAARALSALAQTASH